MSTPTGLDYYGQFADLAPLLILAQQVEDAMYGQNITLILPPSVVPGATVCYGYRVVRADVPTAMLGLTPPQPKGEPNVDR